MRLFRDFRARIAWRVILIGLTMGLNWALQESLQAQSSPLGQPGQRVPMLRPNIGTVRRAS